LLRLPPQDRVVPQPVRLLVKVVEVVVRVALARVAVAEVALAVDREPGAALPRLQRDPLFALRTVGLISRVTGRQLQRRISIADVAAS